MNKSLTSRIVALVCLGLFTLQSFAGTVTGQVQNAAAGPVRNGTFSFTLTAPATVAGTATVVTSSVPCYTDGNGNVAGEPDPLLAPVLSVNLASGTLPAATYFVKIWYFDGTGNSFVSPEASISLVSIGTLNVLSPVKQPLNASGYRIGISTVSGSETIQGSVTGVPGAWGNFSQSAPLTVPAAAAPVSNTTVCTLRFNDELTPSFTCYDVGLTSSTGANIPGFPQYWYLNGGSAGTVNVGSGTPQSNVCQGQGVVYPQAIVSLPPFNGQQTINGPINLNGFSVTAGNGIFTSLTGRIFGICDASAAAYSAGADAGAKINLAEADPSCIMVDATNFTSPTAAATITASKPLLLGAYTLSVSGSPGINIPNTFSYVKGKGRNLTIVSTASGTADIIAIPSATEWYSVFDLAIQSSVARTAGAGIRGSGGHGVIERVAIYPVFDGIVFDTANNSGTSTVRDTEITNGTGSPSAGSGGTWRCGVTTGGVAVGTVSGITLDNVTASMNTAFTDSGICIKDGSDTIMISNSQAVANIGGSDSVPLHIETVNGGAAPSNIQITNSTFEGGLTKNGVVIDAGLNVKFNTVTVQSSLNGVLVNSCVACSFKGGTIHLNQQHGLKIVSAFYTTVEGVHFSDNSQAVTNTSDDVFVTANVTNFQIRNNFHADFSVTGKVCKWGVEVAAGTSNNYVIDDVNPGSCATGQISDSGTGTSKRVCSLGNSCNFGASSVELMETTAPSGVTAAALLWDDPLDHLVHQNVNNGGNQQIPLILFITTNYTNATTTFSDTAITFTAAASRRYSLTCQITWQGSAGTTGPKFQLTGPASPTIVTINMSSAVTATTPIYASAVNASFSNAVANTGTITTATNLPLILTAGILNGANAGTVTLQAAANGAGTLTILAGSYCRLQ